MWAGSQEEVGVSMDGGGGKKEREVQWLAKLRGGQLVQKERFLVSD